MFYILLLYALFGSVFTIAKLGLEVTQPLFFVGTRMVLAGMILVAYEKFVKKGTFQFKAGAWKRMGQLAFFNIYLTNVLEFWGLRYLTSFKTCFIYSLSPFVSALLSYWIFKENMSIKKWIGLIIGFIGFIPILMIHSGSEEIAGNLSFFSWPELAVISAAISSVYGWILLKQLVNENGVSPVNANGFSMLLGGAIALIHSAFVENWAPFPFTNSTLYLECTLALILISNLICYNLYGTLLKRYSATYISFAGFTTPLFSATFGWYFLGETLTWPFYVSFVIVLAGLSIFNQDELKEEFEQKAVV